MDYEYIEDANNPWGDSDYDDYDYDDLREDFAEPGGNSALRAETKDNPRIHPCPTCLRENVLTGLDVAYGYQCNWCADIDEGCL